jgi:DNA-binding CsgD family transcriptional regulator
MVNEIISPTFTEDIANKLNISPRTIQSEIQISQKKEGTI